MPAEHLIPSMQDIVRRAEEARLAEEAARLQAEIGILGEEFAAGDKSVQQNYSRGGPRDGGISPGKSALNKTSQSDKFKLKKNQSGSSSSSGSGSSSSSSDFDSDESDLTEKRRAKRLKRRPSQTS